MPQRLKVHLALFTVATLFSINYIVSKVAMNALAPLSFAWLRVVGSAILLNLIVGRGGEPMTKRDRKEIFGFAILAVGINQCAFLAGLALTSAHVAAILITTIPVFALGAGILLRLERATAAKTGGIVLACAGALLVVGGKGFAASRSAFLGTLLLTLNCLAYALYLVLSKPIMTRLPATRVLARMFAIGVVIMLPLSAPWLLRENWLAVPLSTWIALLVVILGPTVGAYVLSGWALRHAESSLVAAYTYVQPVLATILAAIFLHERLEPPVALAAVMIFAGVAMAGRRTGPIPE